MTAPELVEGVCHLDDDHTGRCGDGAAIVRGNALAIPLGDETVDLIVTSPPYFALRSYRDGGEHYGGQIGSEPSPSAFLDALWTVTAECWRILKPGGSCWVNLGDKHAGSGGHNNANISRLHASDGRATKDRDAVADDDHRTIGATRRQAPDRYQQASDGIRAKSLMGLPWRYAIGCIDGSAAPELPCPLDHEHHGTHAALLASERCQPVKQRWILRSEVVWSKPNGLPESVTDRVRRSHEQWFHLTKSPRYFSDVDVIREPHTHAANGAIFGGTKAVGSAEQVGSSSRTSGHNNDGLNPLGKLPGSVWAIPTQPLVVPDHIGIDHFAAFPTEWPRRIITAWSPPGICTVCGEGRRTTTTTTTTLLTGGADRVSSVPGQPDGRVGARKANSHQITGEACACPDTSAPTRPAVVLDPFGGTGTTAMVARALGRYGVSLDMSADYLRLAEWRIWQSDGAARVRARHEGRTYKPAPTPDPNQLSLLDMEDR